MTDFIKRLLLSLLVATLVYYVFTFLDSLFSKYVETLFLDLRSEAIGTAFTILIVEWIIRNSEKKKWESVKERAMSRVRSALRKSSVAIRYSGPLADEILRKLYAEKSELLKNGPDHYTISQLYKDRYDEMGKKIRWKNATVGYWLALAATLESVVSTSETAMDIFGQNLDPRILSALDKLSVACNRAQSYIVTTLRVGGPDYTDLGAIEMHTEIVFREHKIFGKLLDELDS